MKKFFSLIALVGVFAACNPEDITTAFQVEPATATLQATAVCLEPGFTPASATISYSPSQTVTGTPVLSAGTITATATYGGATGSSTVNYPTIYAGGAATLNTVVTIPYTPGDSDYDFEMKAVKEVPEVTLKQLPAAAHGLGTAETYTFEIDGAEYTVSMLENANEYVLTDSFSYKKYEGAEFVDSTVDFPNADFEDTAVLMVATVASMLPGITETDVTENFNVSAWSLYNVLCPEVKTTTTYNIIATPKAGHNTPELSNPVIASFDVVTMSSGYQVVEMAHPSHAEHYEEGHGHGHGAGSNAGGGLVEAE